MALKIKHRNPKATEFKSSDLVLNITEGTLFYKNNNNNLFKIQGDNLNTPNTELENGLSLREGNLFVGGAIIPTIGETFDLGSPTNIWHTLHIKDDSIKMYKDGKEVGKIQFESGSGLRVRDKEGNTKGIIGNVDGGSF